MSILILDGGLGTSLEDKYSQHFTSTRTPLWSSHLLISSPTILTQCQSDFALAGADVILTPTYQISLKGFQRTRTEEYADGIPRDAVARYLRTAVDVAESAAGKGKGRVTLALGLGPYGATMIPGQEYSGRYEAGMDSEEALHAWHWERLQMFIEAIPRLWDRVGLLAFETLPRLDEIRAVRRAVKDLEITTPFWVSCVFPGEDEKLPDGSTAEEVVEAMMGDLEGAPRPWGLGINCTKMYKLPGTVRKLEDAVGRLMEDGWIREAPALVLYPDGTNGEVYNTTTQRWETPEGGKNDAPRVPWEIQLRDTVKEAEARGVFKQFLVGGCCKATHEDIRRLKGELCPEHNA